jgi:hypothetical protein
MRWLRSFHQVGSSETRSDRGRLTPYDRPDIVEQQTREREGREQRTRDGVLQPESMRGDETPVSERDTPEDV